MNQINLFGFQIKIIEVSLFHPFSSRKVISIQTLFWVFLQKNFFSFFWAFFFFSMKYTSLVVMMCLCGAAHCLSSTWTSVSKPGNQRLWIDQRAFGGGGFITVTSHSHTHHSPLCVPHCIAHCHSRRVGCGGRRACCDRDGRRDDPQPRLLRGLLPLLPAQERFFSGLIRGSWKELIGFDLYLYLHHQHHDHIIVILIAMNIIMILFLNNTNSQLHQLQTQQTCRRW